MHFTFKTISETGQSEFKDRGSKFYGFAFPVDNREQIAHHLADLKKKHPKAVHVCYAYRLGTDGLDFRAHDDGEPSGTAGKPILNQIDSRSLTNVLLAVVRYFGGSLLGVPGLINAYKTCSNACLNNTEIVEILVSRELLLTYNYEQLDQIMIIIKRHNLSILSNHIDLVCETVLKIPLEILNDILEIFENVINLQIELKPLQQ